MIEEWLVGGSENDNLSCLQDVFFTLIQNIQSNKQAKFLSSIQQKISNKFVKALVHGGKIRGNAAKRDQQSNPINFDVMIT